MVGLGLPTQVPHDAKTWQDVKPKLHVNHFLRSKYHFIQLDKVASV